MADSTGISWTDATFNPWIGCTKVSPGCENCYAARQDGFRHWTPSGWGAGQPRKRTKTWGDPVKWNKQPFYECRECGWRGDESAMEVKQVGKDRYRMIGCPACGAGDTALLPARMRVFCASLSDVFDNEVTIEWLVDFLDLCRRTPNLDKLLLTKRIGNVMKRLRDARGHTLTMLNPELAKWLQAWLDGVPPADIWLGATIVNQEEADRDIPKLLAVPAAVRFLSMEPLLGPVDLTNIPLSGHGHHEFDPIITANVLKRATAYPPLPQVNWVIVGGESGPGARAMHPDWARSLRDQCKAVGVPFHFKQWGEWASTWHAQIDPALAAGKPYVHVTPMCRENGSNMSAPNYQLDKVGKKSAGRLLDGVTYDGFPQVATC